MHPLLAVDRVEKRFGAVTAVDRVSFRVEPGEIFALLGPNGAGKTTLIRMLIGLTHPDRGSIAYAATGGASAGMTTPLLPRHRIGYLPEERGLYPDVEVLRTLVYFGVLRGMTRPAASAAAAEWLERMSLADRMREPLKALSKGNQQKVQFISAVLHRPAFALLDEPFSGLDPLNQDLFLGLIRELRREGTTVVLSAHQMQLVERVADRLLVLKEGRTVLHGTLADIRRRWTTGTQLVLRVAGDPSLDFLRRLEPGATTHRRGPGTFELFVREGEPLGRALAAVTENLEILEIESHPVTLHDVYVDTVTNGGRGGTTGDHTGDRTGDSTGDSTGDDPGDADPAADDSDSADPAAAYLTRGEPDAVRGRAPDRGSS